MGQLRIDLSAHPTTDGGVRLKIRRGFWGRLFPSTVDMPPDVARDLAGVLEQAAEDAELDEG